MKRHFDILVVGAGMAGLTFAALLARGRAREHIDLRVVDAGPRPRFDRRDEIDLRVSAIATGSAALLDDLGAWQSVIETRACPYDHMRVWDCSSVVQSSATLRFDAADFAVAQLGHIVENCLIRQALLEVVEELGVSVRFESAAASLDADLVVGADGATSFVREQAGIHTRDHSYGQIAFTAHLRPERPHRHTAWQRFLRDGPLGILPLADGRVSVVWSTSESAAARAMQATDIELGQMLSDASDYVLGNLTASGPRGNFALQARHAQHYVKDRLALIGDAAHAIHPLAGQGANLGFQDAASLAAVIDAALQNNEYPGDRPVLRRYERARKGDNATMLHAMTGLNRLFTTDSAVVRELRQLGMYLFNYSGPIRQYAAKVALGR